MTKKYNKQILKIKQEKMREIAFDLIFPFRRGSIIFELGCAEGNFAKLLNEKNITNYIGVDIKKEKIKKAQSTYPNMIFRCVDVCNSDIMENIGAFVSFQALEHVGTKGGKEDIEILSRLNKGATAIFSVPNSAYRDRHMRWFEINGWKARYGDILYFDFEMTVQHPTKKSKRSFLFRGHRK